MYHYVNAMSTFLKAVFGLSPISIDLQPGFTGLF